MNGTIGMEGRAGRILYFIRTRYGLPKHAVYSALWTWALWSLAGAASQTVGALVSSMVLVFELLLFLRAVDELKDLPYDRIANPDRALPSGLVSTRDVCILLGVLGPLVLIHAASLGNGAFWASLAVLGYSLALWFADARFPRFEGAILLNLVFSIQLKVGIAVTVLLAAGVAHAGEWSAPHAPFAQAIFLVLAYLHFEIFRKTARPAARSEKAYSNEIGVAGSLALGWAVLVSALVGLSQSMGFFVLACALPSVVGTGVFFLRGKGSFLAAAGLTSYLGLLVYIIVRSALGAGT